MFDVEELCERCGFMVGGEMKILDSVAALKARYGKRSVRMTYGQPGLERSADFPLEKLGDNAEFLKLARAEDIRTLHSQEATLDHVFTQVTGVELSAATAE